MSEMRYRGATAAILACGLAGFVLLSSGSAADPNSERLAKLRVLGKAFYENPTTQAQAVEQLKQAWQLNPANAVDRLNYGLSLLRNGQTAEGIAELEAVQKIDPALPHTWFNLGIEYKRQGETEKAIGQLERHGTTRSGRGHHTVQPGHAVQNAGRIEEFGGRKRFYPLKARAADGSDALRAVSKKDRSYAGGFKRDFHGVAEMHSVEFDFGAAAKDGRAVLVLNGWVDWADGSTFLARAQASKDGLQPPRLEVKNERGEWVTALADMGMPAGKPKTIAVDLTGKWASSSREIRIATNLCLFWDEVFLLEGSGAPETRLTRLLPARTHLQIPRLRRSPGTSAASAARGVQLWGGASEFGVEPDSGHVYTLRRCDGAVVGNR